MAWRIVASRHVGLYARINRHSLPEGSNDFLSENACIFLRQSTCEAFPSSVIAAAALTLGAQLWDGVTMALFDLPG
jgi:hypothetical protein